MHRRCHDRAPGGASLRPVPANSKDATGCGVMRADPLPTLLPTRPDRADAPRRTPEPRAARRIYRRGAPRPPGRADRAARLRPGGSAVAPAGGPLRPGGRHRPREGRRAMARPAAVGGPRRRSGGDGICSGIAFTSTGRLIDDVLAEVRGVDPREDAWACPGDAGPGRAARVPHRQHRRRAARCPARATWSWTTRPTGWRTTTADHLALPAARRWRRRCCAPTTRCRRCCTRSRCTATCGGASPATTRRSTSAAVLYLFVRGMAGPQTRRGGQRRLRLVAAGAALVVELSDLLAGRLAPYDP